MNKKTTTIKKVFNIKKLAGILLTLGVMATLTGCDPTWDDLSTVLVNPKQAIQDIADRNIAIINDYKQAGLITTASAESSVNAIQSKANAIVNGKPIDFINGLSESITGLQKSETGHIKCDLFDKIPGDWKTKLEAKDNPIPMDFMDVGFYQSMLTNMNKRIFVLNPDLTPEQYKECVTVCENAVARPFDSKAIQALTDARNSYFVDSGKTLHQYTQEELFAVSEYSPDTAIGTLGENTKNALNKDVGLLGTTTVTTTDADGNQKEDTAPRVVITLRIREFSKEFAEQVSKDRITKDKYLIPQVQVGGDTQLDPASMNRVYLMEYPVKVLNTIQLGTKDTKADIGSDTYAPIFADSDMKVNLGSGEMLWKGKVINKDTKESEKIYHVSGDNPSFAFIKDGGNTTRTEDLAKDIQLTSKVDLSYDESAFPSSLKTNTAYSMGYLSGTFGSTTQKKFDGIDGDYIGVNIGGKDVYLRYLTLKGDGPSLIQQKWDSPGGKADEVVDLRDNKLGGHIADALLTESAIGTYGAGAYGNFGPPEGKQPTNSTGPNLDTLVNDSNYTGIGAVSDPDESPYLNYFNYKTLLPTRPQIGSTQHINWPYVQFAGLTDIPTKEEVGLSESQYKVFLSSPEILNVARKYNEDNLSYPQTSVAPGSSVKTDWCQEDSLIFFLPEYTIPNTELQGGDIGTTIKKEDIDQTLLKKDGDKYIYTYNGVDYYCTSPYDTSKEVNSASIILLDYLELTYMPGVYPYGSEPKDSEPFVATGRRVKLTKSIGGKTNQGLDTDIAVFANKFGKPIEENDGSTVIKIGDLVDFSSGRGYYDQVGEKLGLGVKNLDRIQTALNGTDRDGKLKNIFEDRPAGEDPPPNTTGIGDTGLMADGKLLKYEAYFDWIRPVLMFATQGDGDDRPDLAAIDQTNMDYVFYGLCVDTDAFKTHLYTDWIDKQGDGGDNGSLAWWNGWLGTHGFNYRIDADALKGAMADVYTDSIANKDNTIIFNMNTLNKVNEIFKERDTQNKERSRSTIFTVLGVALFGYGFILALLWVIDTNLMNGPGLLTWATFGKFQAITDKDDMPFYSDNGRTCVTLGQLLWIVLGLWVFASILVLVDVTAIWSWSLEFIKNIGAELKKLMFNIM